MWKYNASGTAEGCNDVATLIYDVDDDGSNEVIVPGSCNPKTFCFNGADGSVRWVANTSGSDSPPVISDLDNDGIPDVTHGEFGGSVRSFNAQTGEQNWHFYVDDNSWIQTAPTAVDLDENGQIDFVVATWNFSDDDSIYVYNGGDLSLMWSYPMNDVVYHGTAVADLDQDGHVELILGDYSGTVTALHADGSLYWTYVAGGYVGSPVSVADTDGDGWCELVFCASDKMTALNHDGSFLWEYDLPSYSTAFRGAALCDMNNDGNPDAVFGTSFGEVMAVDGVNGDRLWSVDLAAHYGSEFDINHAPVIGDLDQDGYLDVFLVGGYTEYPDFSVNYGRGYALGTDQPATPDNIWPMFQYDAQRRGSRCTFETTGVTEVETAGIQVYPNPVGDERKIQVVFSGEEILQFQVTDMQGRLVLSEQGPYNGSTTLYAEGWAPGIYLIQAEMPNGRASCLLALE